MKKPLVIFGIVAALLVAFTLISESSNKSAKAPQKAAAPAHDVSAAADAGHGDAVPEEAVQQERRRLPDPSEAHTSGKINCKTCHECEYPTKENPCLVACPKNAVSVHHSPEQAPEVLVLDDLSQKYGSVVFTHKVHAQMSEMSHGCNGCHHYNTTGPVLNCKKCHAKERKRDEIGTPDLTAAYHRQCMPCHRKWSKATDCVYCHELKTAKGTTQTQQEKVRKATGKTHPRSAEPTRLVYNTSSGTGRYVTFYHNEHVSKFNLPCTGCHKGEKCVSCHEVKTAEEKKKEEKVAAQQSFGTRHKRCAACHDTRNCNTCHGSTVAAPFQHAVNARWDLGRFHSRLSCQKCHGTGYPIKRLDARCASCHTTWKLGSFNHAVTGLSLSKNHQDVQCTSCHPGKDFSKTPVCRECHDERAYPRVLPGTRKDKKGTTAL